MTPFQLTYEGVIAAGRKAFEENRLQAQQGEPGCTYRSDEGLPCVVGAALPDEVAQVLIERGLNSCGISSLFGVHRNATIDLLAPVHTEELKRIRDLQSKHDVVVVVDGGGESPRIKPEELEALRAALFEGAIQ